MRGRYHHDRETGECTALPPVPTQLYRAEVVPPETLIALERVVE